MKLQPNALRFHNWQGEVTRSLLWVVGCFVSLYSSYESCVNILDRKLSFDWIPPSFFHMTHQKQKPTSLFPFVGWSWFLFFFLWQNITFPFPFCWVVMAFVFPLAKHHISSSLLLGYLFAMLGTENWTEAFCFQIEEVFWPSLSLPPFLPPQKNMKTKNVSKLLVHFIHVTNNLSKYITSSPPPDISTTFLSRIKVVCTMHMWVPKMNKANLT